MAESAAELEQRAERAVRRGELLEALQLFEELIVREPGDERVRQRMESVRALVQPAELSDRRRPEPEEAEPRPATGTLTDAEQGELHASAGRFVEALRCYWRSCASWLRPARGPTSVSPSSSRRRPRRTRSRGRRRDPTR